jgi:hypothetical protein
VPVAARLPGSAVECMKTTSLSPTVAVLERAGLIRARSISVADGGAWPTATALVRDSVLVCDFGMAPYAVSK